MTNESEQSASKVTKKKVKKVIEISSSEDEAEAQAPTTTSAAAADAAKKRKVTFTAQVKVSSKKPKASSCAKKSTTSSPGPRKPDRDQLLYILEGGGEEEGRKVTTLKTGSEKVSTPAILNRNVSPRALEIETTTMDASVTSSEKGVVVKRVKTGGSTVIVDEDNSLSLDLKEIEKIVGHSMKDSRMVVVFKNAPPVKSGGKNKENKDQGTNGSISPSMKTSEVPRVAHTGDDDIFIQKRRYKDTFDKYFYEETAVCEHNDSLESESSEEEETYMFPIKNSAGKTNKTTALGKKGGGETKMSVVSNLMDEVTTDLPQWVAHSRPGSTKFWLARLEVGEEADSSSAPLTVPKFIEFDEEFNAKTYVNQSLVESLSGVYDSYEAVKNLLYSVDRYETER